MDSDFDMFVMRDSSRRFAQAPVFSDYVIRLEDTAVTDAELDSFDHRLACDLRVEKVRACASSMRQCNRWFLLLIHKLLRMLLRNELRT
ncbi:hypothetical protein D9615_006727 [Tricholomella constricta]|uniref:Uncharacterized protein n=1 Tax=Tricholomella constricta TaxID=117010 RepID=A0A8H5H6W6_9AGAR|nr:hypothetical protein D9615_006727 [Tricholomella constricta]